MKKIILIFILFVLSICPVALSSMGKSPVCPFLEGKNISILGDSYSTYLGWIPQGYAVWYSGNRKNNNVTNVNQTWWWKLCDKAKCTLLTNSSFSGSTICNTGYGHRDVSETSFIARMKKDMGEAQVLKVKPQVIFVFGGTNDCWAGVPLGVPKYEDWYPGELYETFPAACYMISYLKTWNPGARIIILLNSELKAEFYQGMQEICKHYEVESIMLHNISKGDGHPDQDGMEAIANQIIEYINR